MNMPQKAIRGKKEQCRDRNEEKTRLRERKGKRWFSGSKTESGRSTAFYGLCATVSLVTVPSRYRRPYSDQLIYLITFWRWGLYPCVSWMFLLHTLLLKAKLRHWSEARVRKIYSSFSLSPLATWQIFCAPGPNWYIHFALSPSPENIQGVIRRLPTVRPSSDSPIFGSKNRHEITVISRGCGRGSRSEEPPICGFSTLIASYPKMHSMSNN